jgi:putative intracellular protease/amidase
VSTSTGWPVGFWWSELTHPYYAFTEAGWVVDVYSPEGGDCQWDAMSDPDDASQWQREDVISRGYKHDPAFLELVQHTRPVRDLDVDAYDVLVVAGGQGPMFTFKEATDLQAKFVEFYETGKVTSALCHGTAILAFATLSSGRPLVQGKTVTGFPNVEEDLADEMTWQAGALPEGQHIMPWRIEDALNDLGANYIQAGAFRSFAIRDGNLVTGQQNFSGAETAKLILEAVGR